MNLILAITEICDMIAIAMKLLTLITAAGSVSATAFAGSTAPVQTAPAPAPTLGGWFVGGGFGQISTDSDIDNDADSVDPNGGGFSILANRGQRIPTGTPSATTGDHYSIDDFDFEMYTLHVGRDLGVQFLGCDLAAYLEVGYLNGDASLGLYESSISGPALSGTTGVDIEIIPITFNLKAERILFGSIKGYISGGIGYAFTNTELLGDDDSDGGFFAQASMGLAYDVTDNWEIYGGARYLWLSELDLGDTVGSSELDNNVGYEVGLRYSF
jgi:hypothetical protein